MDAPSSEPRSSPPSTPLGCVFWIALFAPIALYLIGLKLGAYVSSDPGTVFVNLAGITALLSSSTCAVMIANRHGAGPGILSFFGFVLLYGGVAFAGCVAFMKL